MKEFFVRHKLVLTIVLINACLLVGVSGYRLGAGIDFVLGGLVIACTYLSHSVSKSAKTFILLTVNLLLSVGVGSMIAVQLYYHFVSSDFMTLYVGNIFTLGLMVITVAYAIPFVFIKKFKSTQGTPDTPFI